MMTYSFSKQRNSSSSTIFQTGTLLLFRRTCRDNQFTFTLCRNNSNSGMALTADTNVNALSSFTAYISAIHLRLNTSFIDIYALFFGNIFDFF